MLVELKARFDEENNIHWALKLERAGCHVVYGVPGLKTHCKLLLVVRREPDGLRRYLHLGTGNYNDSTARLYTDMGLFTCDESMGADASALFNRLTGYARPRRFVKLAAAPEGLRKLFEELIDTEIRHARRGAPSGIYLKINALSDPALIGRLYEASRAGVPVRLVVRGICCLTAGVPGLSENITVVSLVGQLLEHSRIYRFENGGEPRIFLGSADWMPRNLDRRVELAFPVEDAEARRRVEQVVALTLGDTANARRQTPQGMYEPVMGQRSLNSQRRLWELASRAARRSGRADVTEAKGEKTDAAGGDADQRRGLPGAERGNARRGERVVRVLRRRGDHRSFGRI